MNFMYADLRALGIWATIYDVIIAVDNDESLHLALKKVRLLALTHLQDR